MINEANSDIWMKQQHKRHLPLCLHQARKSDDGASFNKGAPPQVGGVQNKCDRRRTNLYLVKGYNGCTLEDTAPVTSCCTTLFYTLFLTVYAECKFNTRALCCISCLLSKVINGELKWWRKLSQLLNYFCQKMARVLFLMLQANIWTFEGSWATLKIVEGHFCSRGLIKCLRDLADHESIDNMPKGLRMCKS